MHTAPLMLPIHATNHQNELFIVSKMLHKARTCHSDTYIVL